MAAIFDPSTPRPLPAMVDAQIRILVRSIRCLRLCGLRPLYHLVPRGHRRDRRNRRHSCHRQRTESRCWKMNEDSLATLAGHRFLQGLSQSQLTALAEFARPMTAEAGAYLFREGNLADTCYLLQTGRVAIEIRPTAGRGVCADACARRRSRLVLDDSALMFGSLTLGHRCRSSSGVSMDRGFG